MTNCDVAIIGAGPYGLSLAAHLRPLGVRFRIFGGAMEFWQNNMPKGMHLKSEGFASSIYDPGATLTLEAYCRSQRLPYEHVGRPVPLETFISYGRAFQERFVPELEDRRVTSISGSADGFRVILDNGETMNARRVVVAVGIGHFVHLPEEWSGLPKSLVSHSSAHSSTEDFKGQKVAVIGTGASAIDLAALLHGSGASVEVFARKPVIQFHDRGQFPRPLLQRLRYPSTGIGPGWKSFFYTNAPHAFRHMPEQLRLRIVQQHLGPAPAWFVKDQVVGKVSLSLGVTIRGLSQDNGGVSIQLSDSNGRQRTAQVDHVIAATGYKVKIDRLAFLSPEMVGSIQTVGQAPALSSTFESSIPGLYFVGASAANTFGPVMRFAFGARFATERLSRSLGAVSRAAVSTRNARASGIDNKVAASVSAEQKAAGYTT
jgi:thioredoxin reductase